MKWYRIVYIIMVFLWLVHFIKRYVKTKKDTSLNEEEKSERLNKISGFLVFYIFFAILSVILILWELFD